MVDWSVALNPMLWGRRVTARVRLQRLSQDAPRAAKALLDKPEWNRRLGVQLLDAGRRVLVETGVWTQAQADAYMAQDVQTRLTQWADGTITAQIQPTLVKLEEEAAADEGFFGPLWRALRIGLGVVAAIFFLVVLFLVVKLVK